MKKIFVLATALSMFTGISQAAEKDIDVKAANTVAADNKSAAPATATAINTAELLKENQSLRSALAKVSEEKETLTSQLNYAHSMYAATESLHEVQLQKQQEEAKTQAGFAWMMHNVILKLSNALTASK